MRILINDSDRCKEHYRKAFYSRGYEKNELVFFHSFESIKEFIIEHLEKNKLHVDLIITNSTSDTSNDFLKANQLCSFKNQLRSSFSKRNFRISSIPIILYSKNETKSTDYHSGFNAIIEKKSNGDYEYFISVCEKLIKNWRTSLYDDLENLEINSMPLRNFHNSVNFKKKYSKKITPKAESYFVHKTSVVSLEFIKCPAMLNYDWVVSNELEIEETILQYIDTYRHHVKYDRRNGERTILHNFFRNNKSILLRDSYSEMKYEMNLKEKKSRKSEECDFILKTELPDFLDTTFFEVKKEDVVFYTGKKSKRPQFTMDFFAHLNQVWGYRQFAKSTVNKDELSLKLNYSTQNFSFVLLAGRLEEKEEMKELFEPEINRMFRGIKVLTFEELEKLNVNRLEKFNRLSV